MQDTVDLRVTVFQPSSTNIGVLVVDLEVHVLDVILKLFGTVDAGRPCTQTNDLDGA
jgi:hypothetical protein